MKILLLFLSILTCFTVSGQDQLVLEKSVLKINIDDFKQYAYGQDPKNSLSGTYDKEIQPISSVEDAHKFISHLYTDLNGALKVDIRNWLRDNLTLKKRTAIILVQHPLDLKKLFADNSAEKANISSKYSASCQLHSEQKAYLKTVEARLKTLYRGNLITPVVKSEVDELLRIKKSLEEEIQISGDELNKLAEDFREISDQFVESNQVQHFLLNKEKGKWSDYLYNKSNILMVVVGSENDLVNATIQVDNQKNSFEKSLDELKDLAGSLELYDGTRYFSDTPTSTCDFTEKTEVKDEIAITFLRLNPNSIKPPSVISIEHDSLSEELSFEIHERSSAQIKVGFSGAFVDRKQLTISSTNELTIQKDAINTDELKSNLIAMIDFYPWGRDLDRLDPMWKKNNFIPAISTKRLGVFLGVKLSKDPLEILQGGLSYAITKDFSLNSGLSFVSTLKDVSAQPVGVGATLDFLKENADRKYEPYFHFGFSMSASAIGDLLSDDD